MKLSEENLKTLLLCLHQVIEQQAEKTADQLSRADLTNLLFYPPKGGFTREEEQGLMQLHGNNILRSAIRKILAHNSAAVVFEFLNLIDGNAAPDDELGAWTGITLSDLEEDTLEEREMLRDSFYETYRDWKKIDPKKNGNWSWLKTKVEPGFNDQAFFDINFFMIKWTSWLKFAGINLLFALVILLPFLPGPSNDIVIGVSAIAQAAGFFGLLLIPIGLVWVIIDRRNQINKSGGKWGSKPFFILAILSCIIAFPIYFLLVAAIFFTYGLSAGVVTLLIGAYALHLSVKGIRKITKEQSLRLNFVPFYLITIPLLSLLMRLYVAPPISAYSRNLAIERSKVLITAIEEFKMKQGKYPESLEQLQPVYLSEIPSPKIMGILHFRYNRIEDRYSVSFSQWLEIGSLEEIVLYDKTNLRNNLQGEYAKYNYGLDLWRVHGAFASYETGHDHWRYYHCD